ncbi:hypothetical protein KUTeg_024534 [Tegillarca granosa]|uniref:DUF4592 domain-containing protein n=1 Tax=Tegillarca granosa TaxID=220873 RepID=A0ABQ9E3X8_TEGGR|nr:hypothetical protein KUTeg_024534 [Tegillarca granosa]
MPLPPGSKSRSLENERSLISIEGDEGDIFRSNWGASVDGKRPRSTGSLSDEQVDMDFAAMSVDTPTLASNAARHKISVKPKSRRLSTKSFRRNREAAGSPLPEVKEESVTPREEPATKLPETVKNISTQENKTVIQINGFGKEDNRVTSIKKAVDENTAMKSASLPRNLEKTEVVRKHSGQEEPKSPIRQPQPQVSPVSGGLEEVKLRKPRPTSLIETRGSDNSEKSELANAFKRMSVKREESPLKEEGGKVTDVVQAKKEKEIVIDSFDFTKSGGAVSNKENNSKFGVSLKSTTPTSPIKSPTSGVTFVLKKEPLKPQSSSTKNENVRPASANDTKVTNEKDVTVQGEVTPKLSPTKNSVKENEDKLTKLPSPREEYRAKREGRSKTLPEQPVSKDFLNQKDYSSTAKFSQSLSNKDEHSEKVESKPETATSPIGRRTEPKRMSWVGSSSSSTSESSVPSWIEMAKKRQGGEVNEVEKKEPKPVVSLSREPAKVKSTDSSVTSSSGATKEQKDIFNGSKKSPDEQKDKDFVTKPSTTTSSKPDIHKPLVSKLSDSKTETQPVSKPLVGKLTDNKTEVQSVNKSVSSKVSENKMETQTDIKPAVEKLSDSKPESIPVKPVIGKLTDVKSDTQQESKPLVRKPSDVKVETQSISKTYSTKTEPEVKSVPVSARIMAMKKETETQQQLHKSATQPSKIQPVKKDTEPVNKLSSNTKTQEVKEVKKDQEPIHKPLITKVSDGKKENENVVTSLAGKTSLFEKKNVTSGSSVPAWKSNLQKKDKEVKIEIIEKPSATVPVNTVQPKPTATKSVEEKPSVLREKPVEKCNDGATNRKSKVLDLVKNYQKLQVS